MRAVMVVLIMIRLLGLGNEAERPHGGEQGEQHVVQ